MSIFTLDWLKSVTLDEFKKVAGRVGPGSQELADLNALLSSPEGRAIASDMVGDPDYVPVSKRTPSAEEAEQIAADTQLADEQAALAEAARVAAEAAAVVAAPPKVEEKKKIVIDYQATDENGKAIGRPTHIEGWTNEEVIEKLQAAHINAVRYAERVKKNRVRESAATVQGLESNAAIEMAKAKANTLAEQAVNEKDPAKMKEAAQLTIEAEREKAQTEEAFRQHGKILVDTWMTDHEDDFTPCLANSNILAEYLQTQKLQLTYENLEKAFEATKPRLAAPAKAVAPVVSAPAPTETNSPVVAAAATVAPPASITPTVAEAVVQETSAQPVVPQPQATAPTTTSAAAAQSATPARRPGVNGSVMPGSLSAARPTVVQTQPQDTKASLLKEIAKMPSAEYRKKLKDANYVKRLVAAGIPVVGGRI